MLHPRLAHGHDVGVALYQNGPVLPHNGVPSHVDAIQSAGFVVERALRAVDVFRDLLVRLERPATKTDEPPRDVPNGENHTPTIKVIECSVLALLAQATGHKPLVLVSSLSSGPASAPSSDHGRSGQ